jgi:hypothetical protein
MSDMQTENTTRFSGGFDTPHAAGMLVILALLLLFGVRRFFGSINVSAGAGR